MKTFKKILIAGILLITSLTIVSAQSNNLPEELEQSLKKGNSTILAKYFGDRVELSILNKESIYSKPQATQIMTKFFKESQPTDFRKKHAGGKAGTSYVIGDLITKKGNFRVNFLLKKNGSVFKIHQLHIEKE